MRRTTIVIADGPRRLRVTVEAEPEPINTDGVEIPGPPRLPRELRETVRPGPARVVPMPSRKQVA